MTADDFRMPSAYRDVPSVATNRTVMTAEPLPLSDAELENLQANWAIGSPYDIGNGLVSRLLATITQARATIAARDATIKQLLADSGSLWKEKYRELAAADTAERDALKAEVETMRAALKLVRFNWAGHADECAYARAGGEEKWKCDCDWPKIRTHIDAALSIKDKAT